MTRISLNLSDKTARRFREAALKQTGSMKGLSEVGEEALREYLDKNYPNRMTFVVKRGHVKDIQAPTETLAEPDPAEEIQQTI
jgi:metal-responsive CopG/Arc/MetJ family transcriptional regulator